MSIAERVAAVRERIAAAAARAGRDPGAVTLVAVSKSVPVAAMREAYAAGIRHFGENRAQEARDKFPAFGDDVHWHFVGRLQTNKVKYIVRHCHLLHSLDRVALAQEVDRRASRCGRVLPCLVEVNVAGEATKAGLPPEKVIPFLQQVAGRPGLRVVGLMTVAPRADNPEEVRPVFRRLRQLLEEAAERCRGLPGIEMRHLSMGMTDDFEVAVEEGATIVRIGRAIFGERG
ncbi:YggS family pyridoxal phosphate-dependent enzyme [Thermaerobacter sp. FW80]|uniref:YggS family pyridoxal phosphate-dependent enzyme n=1 Tax=Thermaerobacter sp. FW80 TaxID=2546351 RepID=UPI000DB38D3A|nr:YggS family pyridoxal phosphate-dependent enzyme [Thermaerobacter sp. FW80]PZN06601.1 MAG: YggS family pyridoxal phosphate-dependent enzyme [Bacillota bacterium]QBS37735.1 YggS family pyridoxal phosphate-dependent enzyme [Thermaerobacter sp. FW80]